MKKKALALLLALLLIIGLCACGASSATISEDTASGTNAEAPEAEYQYETDTGEYGGIADADSQAALPDASAEDGTTTADKIIYSAYAEIETRDFETSAYAE